MSAGVNGASIDAIVVSYKTGPRLKECLWALRAHNGIGRIVIVDNGNPPGMTAWLDGFASRTPHAVLHRSRENLGFGRAVNLGVGLGDAGQLLIVNPDCVIRPDALAPLQTAARNCVSPWIVGGRIFELDGKAARGPQRRELTIGRALSRLVGGAGINMPLEPQPVGPKSVEVISGAFFLADRAGFERLGGFDEDYFLHVEDIDLCRRVREAGGQIVYQPLAGALHFGATSDVSTLFVERHKARSFARYFRKFAKGASGRLAAELAIPVIAASLLARTVLAGFFPRGH